MTDQRCPNCNRKLKVGGDGTTRYFYCESCDREKKKSEDFKEGLSRGMI